ncbi:hypothetical protein ACIPSA_24855 [Streptomyces sp. NPDC086549]|uniref:hypothetical protein n=1 Tax=Streptomyces sp. NPDC086549 TaxID=3365752 RepID=UPI0038102FB4
MSRNDTTSCAGLGCAGLVLLQLWVPVGYLLAAPVTVPALLAAQSSPVRMPPAGPWALVCVALLVAGLVTWRAGHRVRVRPWLLLAQSGGLVGLSVAVSLWVRSRVEPPALRTARGDPKGAWSLVAEAQTVAVMVVAVVFFLVVRRVSPAPPARWAARVGPVERRSPEPGEIWWCEKTLRSGERKHLPCLVIDRDKELARILWLNRGPGGARDTSVPVLDGTWNTRSPETSSWVDVRRPKAVPLADFGRMMGPCPSGTWHEVHKAAG